MDKNISVWFCISVVILLSSIQGQQANNYAGLEKIYEGILQGYNRNLRPGKFGPFESSSNAGGSTLSTIPASSVVNISSIAGNVDNVIAI